MAQLTLEVCQKQYKWKLPGSEEATVNQLKDHIGERCKGDVLYHRKLRFSSGGKNLSDDDAVPLAPAVVQVAGPASVVQMFSLFCDRDGKPLPKAPKSLPKPAPAPSPAPRPQTGYGGGFGAPAPQQDMLMLTNSWSPAWNQAAQEEQDLSEALRASRAAFQADEEAQLRWALEESALLAEQERHQREEEMAKVAAQEEIKKFYMQDVQKKSKGSSTSSTTARAEAALQELESEGAAWDSDSKDDLEEGSDSDDDGPPPLELLPDSEE